MQIIVPELDRKIVEIIKPDFENGPWICGGACMSWIQGETVPETRDIDVYFKNERQRQEFINRMSATVLHDSYDDRGNGTSWEVKEKKHEQPWSYTCVTNTDNSLTMWIRVDGKQWTVQAIKLYYSENINEIFDKFDITACKIATDGYTYRVGSPHTVTHIFQKIIDIPALKKNSVTRIIKYLSKGYSLTEETYDRLIFDSETIWNFGYDNSLEYSEQ